MNSLNQLIIEGVCTGNCNIIGNAVEIEIEVTRNEEKSLFPIFVYGNLAALCKERCTKGKGIRIVGRLTRSKWIDETGKHQAGIGITAEHIDFNGGE